jgi:transcriptional regulator with XRE-family HTH domain
MSFDGAMAESLDIVVARMVGHVGQQIRDERRRRRWPLRELSARSGLSIAHLSAIESGHAGSIQSYAAIALALGRSFEMAMLDPRARAARRSDEDPVHAAMGESEAARLTRPGRIIQLDEPYQHFQFAGRGDLVAWSLADGDLLHLENRTRFPNLQEALGSYNAKRRWLPQAVAERVGRRVPWRSVTHAIVALWSGEVLHTVRIRKASFGATCPDPIALFGAWWDGRPIAPGVHSTFVLLDPVDGALRSRRRFVDLEGALTVRPRYRDYADALAALRREGAV